MASGQEMNMMKVKKKPLGSEIIHTNYPGSHCFVDLNLVHLTQKCSVIYRVPV